jgi:DNA end-binding protein Ku
LNQLRYIDEIKPVDEIEGMDGSAASSSQQPSIDDKELSLVKTLVENLSSKEFDISQYSDEYTKQLEQLINAKITGKQTLNTAGVGKEDDSDVSKNLLEALKASIGQKSKSKR